MPHVPSNPLQLDDRAGSGDLFPLLVARHLPVTLSRLEFGDAACIGNGPDGCPMPVGVEIKSISDALKCICDGRFAGHQLPGLVAAYDYIWLVLEGNYRSDERSGLLQLRNRGQWCDASIGARKFMFRELEQWVLTLTIKAGIRVHHSFNRESTADFLRNLYNWWTSKEWADHRSHLAVHSGHVPDAALLVRPSLSRLVAKELPGIGWEKSAEVAKAFPTVLEMALAAQDDWESVPGIGKITAAKVIRAIQTGK